MLPWWEYSLPFASGSSIPVAGLWVLGALCLPLLVGTFCGWGTTSFPSAFSLKVSFVGSLGLSELVQSYINGLKSKHCLEVIVGIAAWHPA